MEEWFMNPAAGCLYCRKPTQVLNPTGLHNPLDPVYITVPVHTTIIVETLATPVIAANQRSLHYRLVAGSLCIGALLGGAVAAIGTIRQ